MCKHVPGNTSYCCVFIADDQGFEGSHVALGAGWWPRWTVWLWPGPPRWLAPSRLCAPGGGPTLLYSGERSILTHTRRRAALLSGFPPPVLILAFTGFLAFLIDQMSAPASPRRRSTRRRGRRRATSPPSHPPPVCRSVAADVRRSHCSASASRASIDFDTPNALHDIEGLAHFQVYRIYCIRT